MSSRTAAYISRSRLRSRSWHHSLVAPKWTSFLQVHSSAVLQGKQHSRVGRYAQLGPNCTYLTVHACRLNQASSFRSEGPQGPSSVSLQGLPVNGKNWPRPKFSCRDARASPMSLAKEALYPQGLPLSQAEPHHDLLQHGLGQVEQP